MSNPYERILSSRVPRPSENALKQQQQQQKDGRPTPPKKPLSQPTKRRLVEKPPNLRYAVRPRYRFDLPDPPMDPKMLLGRIDTSSYAKPFLSNVERDFRTPALPRDPTVLPLDLVDTSPYTTAVTLNVEDTALLNSIMTGRQGGDLLNQSHRPYLKPEKPSASATIMEPWMRRMSYDEYIARNSAAPRQNLFLKDASEKRRVQDNITPSELQKRKLRGLLQSFDAVRRNGKHPDRRKSHLRPVSVSPILPDFSTLGAKLIALEFDKDHLLTLPQRGKNNPEAAEESVRSTATVFVAESVGGQERKCAVVYTPTSGTLARRKRKQEEVESETDDKDEKKIHFTKDETYRCVGEYSIREGRFGDTVGKGELSRSCFAVTEYRSKEDNKSVACLTPIGTTWKLRTRAQADVSGKLGKEGLKMTRDSNLEAEGDDIKRDILSGVEQARSAEDSERKRT